MSVKIHLLPSMYHDTNGQKTVEVNGDTVGQCLDDLVRLFPTIKQKLFDSNGRLHGYISIFASGRIAYQEEFARAVKPEDELHILLEIDGG